MTSLNTDFILFISWKNFSFKTIVHIEEIPMPYFCITFDYLMFGLKCVCGVGHFNSEQGTGTCTSNLDKSHSVQYFQSERKIHVGQ